MNSRIADEGRIANLASSAVNDTWAPMRSQEVLPLVMGHFCTLLERSHVDASDDFFVDLGGHSMLAMAVCSRIAASVGVPIGIRDINAAPSPLMLSERIARIEQSIKMARDLLATALEPRALVLLRACFSLGSEFPAAASEFFEEHACAVWQTTNVPRRYRGRAEIATMFAQLPPGIEVNIISADEHSASALLLGAGTGVQPASLHISFVLNRHIEELVIGRR